MGYDVSWVTAVSEEIAVSVFRVVSKAKREDRAKGYSTLGPKRDTERQYRDRFGNRGPYEGQRYYIGVLCAIIILPPFIFPARLTLHS